MSNADTAEKHFQTEVVNLAQLAGWSVWHVNDSRKMVVRKDGTRVLVGDKDIAGYPDLTMCHPTRGFVFAELKSEDGTFRPEQIPTLQRLAEAAAATTLTTGTGKVRVHVWRPSDLPTVIVDVLQYGRGPITYGVPL